MRKDVKNRYCRKTIMCILHLIFSISIVYSQNSTISLSNNKYLNIQACDNNIFRFRLSSDKEFQPTLMEKYGIVKTDWDNDNNLVKDKGFYHLKTNKYQVEISEKTGKITVKNLNGKIIISSINVLEEESLLFTDFKQSIESENKTIENRIIGDIEKTKSNVFENKIASKTSESSVLEVSIKPNERFYGGGAASRNNIQHRGSVLKMWATYQKSDIVTPFLISSEGWGIYNNTSALNFFDIGRFQKDKLYLYNTDGTIDFYIMVGESMNEVIDFYTTITGKPYLLPKWAYGLAFGGNMMEDQFVMMNNALRFREEKIPLDIYWIEPQWMAKFYDFSTSKDWDLKKFPAYFFWQNSESNRYENNQLFISKLHKLGYHLALWLCIDHDLSIEEEDIISKKNGDKQSGKEHWFNHLMKFVDHGVDGFKLDPGRTLNEHPDRVYYNGYTDKEMHNLNQILLPKQMYATFKEHKGIRCFHHYCGGYAGTQHWGGSTSGDNGGGRNALYDQLNLGISGFLNTSADVLDGVANIKEGLHFGFFLPWVQINSWASLHYPWYFSTEDKESFRYYAQLRNSLLPYIYSYAIKGSQTGMPILRAMPLEFPNDSNVSNMTSQFMFGEQFLVGVFNDSIYLPKGKWINYWSDEEFLGNQQISCTIPDFAGGQLFVKSGSIIPFQKVSQYVNENPLDTIILKVYPDEKSSFILLEDDGISFDFEKGKMAKTIFECSKENSTVNFIIKPTEGSFAGIKNERTYKIDIRISTKPKQVIVNDNVETNWSYIDKRLSLILPRKDIYKKQTLEIIT